MRFIYLAKLTDYSPKRKDRIFLVIFFFLFCRLEETLISNVMQRKQFIEKTKRASETDLYSDKGVPPIMTELIVPSYLNSRRSGEPAAADYQALLSDSPWKLCHQHCLAFKQPYICQVLLAARFKQLEVLTPPNISGSNGHVCWTSIPHGSPSAEFTVTSLAFRRREWHTGSADGWCVSTQTFTWTHRKRKKKLHPVIALSLFVYLVVPSQKSTSHFFSTTRGFHVQNFVRCF